MPRYAQITCEFVFESSHQLRRDDWSEGENAEVFGQCVRLHGHSYRLLVTLRGRVDPQTGMVMNFRDLRAVVNERVLARLDHHHLNDVIPELTTAENLCHWIARELIPHLGRLLHRIELWETRNAFAALTVEELREIWEGLGGQALA